MHYFVFDNIWNLSNLSKNNLFYILIIALVISFPIAMFLERTFNSPASRAFYMLSAVWVGVLFFMFSLILVYKLASLFVVISPMIALYSIIGVTFILSIYSIAHANSLVVKEINIPISGLKENIKAIQISDIHIGTVNQKDFLEKIVNKVNDLNPDVVFLTGDFVDGSAPISSEIINPINNIKAKTFFVIGNHEIYDGLDKIMPLINNTKLRVLRNETSSFRGMNIIGIDYQEGKAWIPELDNMNISKTKPNILLYHAPTISANDLEKKGIQLMLSGHTHGGQIFPFHLLAWLGNTYLSGLHSSSNNSSYSYTSEGTGTWGPPMRLGTNSEITIINLKPKK